MSLPKIALPRRMAGRPQGAPRQGEGHDQGKATRSTSSDADCHGRGREGLRVRRPGRKVRLIDMFDGRSQLIIYHFMYDPEWDEGCSCTAGTQECRQGSSTTCTRATRVTRWCPRAAREARSVEGEAGGTSPGTRPTAATSTTTSASPSTSPGRNPVSTTTRPKPMGKRSS